MATPTKVETYANDQIARQRIAQIGGRFMAQHSTQARHIYFVASSKSWVMIRREPSGVKISFWQSCPC